MTCHTAAVARTIVVSGSASGMGAATVRRLVDDGHRAIGVDVDDAEVIADLGTSSGRRSAVEQVTDLAAGALDGVVTWAGISGLSDGSGSLLASVNHFGTVELLEGLRPLLARGTEPAAVAIGSNSMTCQPGVPASVIDACLAGDETAARAVAEEAGAVATYPATKLSVTRWVRRHAPRQEWAGSGIRLNVVAPGAVETPLLDRVRKDELLGQFVDSFPVPVGRNGRAEELAGVVAFLLGPDARFLCGSVLFVDGGTDALLRADDHFSPM